MYDTLVRNVRLNGDSPTVDIAIRDGRFVRIGELSGAPAERVIDGEGALALPPFVESHIHLDTVLTSGEPDWNRSGTLFEGIGLWRRRKQRLTREDVLDRARRVLDGLIAQGTLFVRTQADISDPNLTALRALLELKQEVRPYVQLQVIAFPQDGVIACPGNQERLREALRLGADGVGAIPHCEPSREAGYGSMEFVFRLAAERGSMVHVFCDELDDGHSRFLEVTAEWAIRTGLGPKVTAAHACASAYYPEAYLQRLLGLLVQSQINIVACPLINSAMQGRFDPWPKGRGIARIKDFWRAGINVSVAHDDIMTPFYPLGTGSLLQAAHMAAHLAHMTGVEEMEEAVRMVTDRAARTLRIEEQYGLEPGKPASFVLLPVSDVKEALRVQPVCRYVFSQGFQIAETIPSRTLLYSGGQARAVNRYTIFKEGRAGESEPDNSR